MNAIALASNQFPPFPSEYLPGYIARLFHLLASNNMKQFFSFNLSGTIGKTDVLVPKVALNFAYVGESLNGGGAFLASHQNARFWRGFIKEDYFKKSLSTIKANNKCTKRLFDGEEVLASLKPLKWCEECHVQDEDAFGVGIWHSIHQVPTAQRCPIHQCYLKQINLQSPETLLDYPVINESVIKRSSDVYRGEILQQLDIWSGTIMSRPSEETRDWLNDVRADMKYALHLGVGKSTKKQQLYKNWRAFLKSNDWLNQADLQAMQMLTTSNHFTPASLLSGTATTTHPIIFMLLMSFAKEYSSFRVQF